MRHLTFALFAVALLLTAAQADDWSKTYNIEHAPQLRVDTSDGSVSLEIPADLAADLDLHTGDGHIRLNLPLTVEGKFSNQDVHGKLNGGGNRLVVHTGDGSITVDKS
jgi:DUF4097 and DUF4098 domain-containing protein YvlB